MFLCLNYARVSATTATATGFAVAFTRHHEGIIGRFGRTGGVEGSPPTPVCPTLIFEPRRSLADNLGWSRASDPFLQKNVPVKGQIDCENQALDHPARRSKYLG